MRPRQQRQEVANHAGLRVLLSQNMVIQGSFVIIGYARIRLPAEQVSAQLQHIIGATSLTRIAIQEVRETFCIEIMLFLTATSGSKRVMVYHGVPEEVTQCFTVFISCQLIITGFCQYLRYKRVRMFRAQIIICSFKGSITSL